MTDSLGPDLATVPAELMALLAGERLANHHLWLINPDSEEVPEGELVLMIPSFKIPALAAALHEFTSFSEDGLDGELKRQARRNWSRLGNAQTNLEAAPITVSFGDRDVDLEIVPVWDPDWRSGRRAREARGVPTTPPIQLNVFAQWILEELTAKRERAGKPPPGQGYLLEEEALFAELEQGREPGDEGDDRGPEGGVPTDPGPAGPAGAGPGAAAASPAAEGHQQAGEARAQHEGAPEEPGDGGPGSGAGGNSGEAEEVDDGAGLPAGFVPPQMSVPWGGGAARSGRGSRARGPADLRWIGHAVGAASGLARSGRGDGRGTAKSGRAGPPGYSTSSGGATGEGASGEGASGEGATRDGATGEGASGEGATRDGASGEGASGEGATREGAARDGAASRRRRERRRLGRGRHERRRHGEGASGEGATRDGAARDGAARDGAARDGATRDGATRDGATRDGATRDGATRDSATRDSATRDSATRDSATRDSATRDSATRDSLR